VGKELRVRLCIWEGRERCVLGAGLPRPFAVLPWDVYSGVNAVGLLPY
jgi:hypothetical protein